MNWLRGYFYRGRFAAYLKVIDKLQASGAEGIILGCTEIGLLVKPQHTAAILFDTTVIHAEKAVGLALN